MSQLSTIKDIRPKTQTADVARTAGRGTIYITIAKIWFMVSGYGIHYVLSRLMSEQEYGLYNVAVGAVSVINAVIITGTYQTVSKHSESRRRKNEGAETANSSWRRSFAGVFLARPNHRSLPE
jgi:O-antigen/teichoic acid export membrane protein